MKFKSKKEMFLWIYENRPHKSELSGKPLLAPTDFMFHWQFLHILPAGSFPKWKLESNNVILGTPEEHRNQESNPKFKALYAEKKREYYKEFYNKEFD